MVSQVTTRETNEMKITVTERKTPHIDLADFNKKAREIFNNVVRPQIEKAKTVQKTNSIKSNSPI